MNDPRMNNLLKWGIQNSTASQNDPDAPKPSTSIDPQALQELLTGMSGPSDAELMKQKMTIILDPEYTLDQKVIAFEDFEMLIQGIDNANNLEPLKLWTPLIEQLDNPEAELRNYAAWCAGTAVENNEKAQERLLVLGAIPKLVKLATEDDNMAVRKKAVRALSCASRNYQPALDAIVENVPAAMKPENKLDAGDMESVDLIINKLREDASRAR